MYPRERERKRIQKKCKQISDSVEAEYYNIGKQIKAGRERAGLTQSELAMKIGTQKSAISRIETGKQNLSLGMMKKVCDAIERPYKIRLEID